MSHSVLRALSFAAILALAIPELRAAPPSGAIRKQEDIVIYSHDKFYSAFPSIVRRPNGELLVAFRRAPERRAFGEKGTSHTDSNSYLVMVRSKDDGKTWSAEPDLIHADPRGGSQDPCMVQLRDKSIICTSYAWAWVNNDALASMKNPHRHGNFAFLGGYLLRSTDGGQHWSRPIFPPHCPGETSLDIYNQPLPAYNRGAMCEGRDGRLYWVVASNTSLKPRRSSTHLMISADKGKTWEYSCSVAMADNVTFNETSLYQTPKGDFVAFMRTADFNDHTVVARSVDNGKSFQPWRDAGFKGHPHYALQLPDKRVLLVYGYRHAPFGIRARVLDPECTKFDGEEIILRDDGGNGDLGYPWATMVSKNRALVIYYFNQKNGIRHIAGTFVEIGR